MTNFTKRSILFWVLSSVTLLFALNTPNLYAKSDQNRLQPTRDTEAPVQCNVEASLDAVNQLKTYLETPTQKRPPIAEQPFAAVALTHRDAEKAKRLLWNDHIRHIKQTRAEEMNNRQLTMDTLKMPFYYSVHGDMPEDGRSLYISLHGGGGTTTQVNDQQWNNQKRLYRIEEGVYLAPRSPNDAWNMWHQNHIDGMFDRLIENLIVFENVNPNRVYLLGYSAGGDGVYRLAGRMADRWAAAAMMAGHPGDASPINLYNMPFTIHVGGNDRAYNRNLIARQWGDKLQRLQENEPAGYVHWVKVYDDKGHWLDGQDTAALPWMARHTRNSRPKDIIWRQEQHTRFYWLATRQPYHGNIARATLSDQQINLKPGSLEQLIIRIDDRMLNLDKEVIVTAGQTELFKGRIGRTIATLAKTLTERGDPDSMFSGEIVITFTQ